MVHHIVTSTAPATAIAMEPSRRTAAPVLCGLAKFAVGVAVAPEALAGVAVAASKFLPPTTLAVRKSPAVAP